MKTRTSFPFVVSLLGIFAIALTVPAAAREKPVLNRGMYGDVIIELVGKPDEISKLKSEDNKAETWIYRRKMNQTIIQTSNTQTFLPAFIGIGGSGPIIDKVVVPEFRLKYVADYQVTALLMINDKLYLGRQWVERTEKFTD